MVSAQPIQPTAEDLSEVLLCARYGEASDLDDLKAFVEKYGKEILAEAKDERGNTALHMAAGNGHADIVSYLLPLLPSSSLTAVNSALSTPLHWASLNYHLPILRLLCPLLSPPDFLLLNSHGKTPVQEAEEACEAFVVNEGEEDTPRGKERVRREVVVGYLLGCMGLTEGRNEIEKKKVDEMVKDVEVDEGEKEGTKTPTKATSATEGDSAKAVSGVSLDDKTSSS